MSQDFHQGVVFSFSNGFERSTMIHQDQHRQQHIGVQQNPRDKLRLQGFELQPPPPPPPLVGIEEEETGELPVYETGGMLSEMFGFQSGVAPVATDLLDNQIPENYRLQRPSSVEGIDWYGKQHQIPSINADSASAMQLFLMNPHQRSPSPPSHPPPTSSSTLHEFHSSGVTDAAFGGSPIPPAQFNWVTESGGGHNTITQQTSSSKFGGVVESQGLSLSLSSLQHLQAAKAEELRIEDGGMFYYNQGDGVSSSNSYQLKNLGNHMQQMHLQGVGQNQQIHVGYSSVGVVNILRNSKYLKAAHELLEEFCSVGRGQLKNNMIGRLNKNPNTNMGSGGSSSSSKDLPPLLAAERIEHQRRKAALLSMLDEVDRKYGHYCEQMQMVVNSFDSVMGYGAATPYTSLAQKAMSRHFRCLKDAITTQLKLTRDLLGDKEGLGALGVTKGETPRLKLLDQSLRQQRAFHQMGMMEQEAWRPQRGLPERSVNILRAWLFEHFLHPYPSDADKHLLARQTGLSRNQVSNWFINARVRLWKPMVEEMYQQESKDAETTEEEEREILEIERERDRNQSSSSAQTPTPTTPTTQARTTTATTATAKRSEIDALENDSSLNAINGQCFSENKATKATTTSHSDVSPTLMQRISMTHESSMHHHHQLRDVVIGDTCHHGGIVDADYGSNCTTMEMEPSPLIRFGSNTGDVSLTLGLRHAGNLPEKNRFSVGDYRS